MSYKAIDIAKYIINKCTVEHEPVSNMQLQNILYHIQTTFMTLNLTAFEDDFEAWQIGPVVPEVYHMFCGFGAMPICMEYDVDIDQDFAPLINFIVVEKRRLAPWDLAADILQKGSAWDLTYKDGRGAHAVIPKSLIKEKG